MNRSLISIPNLASSSRSPFILACYTSHSRELSTAATKIKRRFKRNLNVSAITQADSNPSSADTVIKARGALERDTDRSLLSRSRAVFEKRGQGVTISIASGSDRPTPRSAASNPRGTKKVSKQRPAKKATKQRPPKGIDALITDELDEILLDEREKVKDAEGKDIHQSPGIPKVPSKKKQTWRQSSAAKQVMKASLQDDVHAEDFADEIHGFERDDAPHLDIEKVRGQRDLGQEVKSDTINASDIDIEEVKPPREAKIANLGRELWKVLFNLGVHTLRDSRTGVWNYPKSLGKIPKPEEFAFNRCPHYITASQDDELMKMTEIHDRPFVGSTSTLTKALSQIYFAISGWRDVNLNSFSQDFAEERTDFTAGAKLPACLLLQRLPNGRYAVDNDKSYDIEENVLSDYGRILEKMLTTEPDDFARFLQTSPESAVPEEEREEREAYYYSKSDRLIMRSQLDCYDPRLPGTGTFDIKTRACISIRHDRANYLASGAYDIFKDKGIENSFEREYYDLVRSGMLKFSFQARIGNMDGIFLAYHNTQRLFGFQYLPLSELDERLFGSTEMADQAFKLCVKLLEEILDQAVLAYPGVSLKLMIKTRPAIDNLDHQISAWVQPLEWDGKDVKPITGITISVKNLIDGEPVSDSIDLRRGGDEPIPQWSIRYTIYKSDSDPKSQSAVRKSLQSTEKELYGMTSLSLPEGKTVSDMSSPIPTPSLSSPSSNTEESTEDNLHPADETPSPTEGAVKIRWKSPDKRINKLRLQAKASGEAYELRRKGWKEDVASMMAGVDSRDVPL